MALLEDVVDNIASGITQIGLSTNGSTEYSGGGYSHQVPSYGSASGGVADLSAPLQFDGTANDGPITHVVYKRASGNVFRPVAQEAPFNSDGRIDVTSAPITAAFPT